MGERNAILAEYSPEQTRAFLQYDLLRRMTPYLTPDFDAPNAAFSVVLFGKDVSPPRDKQVAQATPRLLGHPLSQLYVAKYFKCWNVTPTTTYGTHIVQHCTV